MRLFSLIIPANNEEGGIEAVLRRYVGILRGAGLPEGFEILVVDDGSTDSTAKIVERVAAELNEIKLVRHDRNRGYGAAIKTGIRRSAGTWIGITDADGTYPAEILPEMVRLLADFDMVVGARIGSSVAIPAIRKPAKWFITKLACFLAGERIPDLNSGLRVFHRGLFNRFLNLMPSGFSLTTTLTLAALCNGYMVKYVPIDYHARTGSSKIRPIHDTFNFIMLIVRSTTAFNPLKIFLPLGMGSMLLGIIKGSYGVIALNNLSKSDLLLLVTGVQILVLGLVADLISRRS